MSSKKNFKGIEKTVLLDDFFKEEVFEANNKSFPLLLKILEKHSEDIVKIEEKCENSTYFFNTGVVRVYNIGQEKIFIKYSPDIPKGISLTLESSRLRNGNNNHYKEKSSEDWEEFLNE